MWPFRSRKRERAEEREVFLQALTAIADSFADAQRSQSEAVAKLAEASAAQAASFQSHLDLFKVAGPPKGWIVRDEDEYAKELERLGFPTEASMREQLDFVLKKSADPET